MSSVRYNSAMSEKQPSKRISEMRNLGPACERDLNLAGIYTEEQVKRLGVEETFIRMLIARRKNDAKLSCCNAAYLYAIHGAIYDLDWRDVPEPDKKRYKKLTAELRESGMQIRSGKRFE